MDRRQFIQAAALLVAGAKVAPASWALTEEQRVFLASQPDYIDRGALDFFSETQRAAITAAAEQTIPATDTPGATDAGVPRFIELMVRDWLNDDERALFMQGLDDMLARAGGDFAAMDAGAQLALLEQLEDEASDDSWYDLGNVTRVWSDGSPFICQLKELTVFGFFLSGVGATKVLRENPMGSFDGDIPLEPGQPAWASETPLRGMVRD